jgi:hypothetical protein
VRGIATPRLTPFFVMTGLARSASPALGLDPRVPAIHVLSCPRRRASSNPRRLECLMRDLRGTAYWIPACAGMTSVKSLPETKPRHSGASRNPAARSAKYKCSPRPGGCIQFFFAPAGASWIPAFAGMTDRCFRDLSPHPEPPLHCTHHVLSKGASRGVAEAGRGAAPAGLVRKRAARAASGLRPGSLRSPPRSWLKVFYCAIGLRPT